MKNDWNSNGKYVEYTLQKGETLNVWRGEAAAQELRGSGGYDLPGGAQQIRLPPNTITPAAPKPTGW